MGDAILPSELLRDRPLVTVAVLTYNHEKYITEAVESVLEQRTSFPVEILIGEDCSTDRTRAMLSDLERIHPGRFTVLRRERNLGLSANLQECRERARGRYLAILEGDDYWTDPLKLQKLCDSIEAHPDWSMCYHSCLVHFENRSARDHSSRDFVAPQPPPTLPFGVRDLLKKNLVPTLSVALFRQGVIERTPPWHEGLRCGDWALYILHADRGPVGFLPEVMTNYRVHRGGLWSGFGSYDRWEQVLSMFDHLQEHFQGRYRAEIESARKTIREEIAARVAELEKIDHRYHSLQLNRVAGVFKWIRETWKRTRGLVK